MDARETTLTFLFTDIEGSTRLWEAHPRAMRVALARHDAILRAAVETAGGHVFKTVGDAFYAAFPTAASAVGAALDAQRVLGGESWGETGELRVRMAIHAGAVEVRDGDYFGRPLNRVARLLALAQGGQVLVSGVARAFLEGALPEGAALRDLGDARLRDVEGSERVSQLVHPALGDVFAPLASSSGPTNLPRELSSFLGRDEALKDVEALLEDSRLVTLTGAGGTGKTRLALQVGEGVRSRFPEGVWLVELAGVRSGSVASAVASATGCRESPGRPVADSVVEGLASREMLLILDNCEHVLDDAAPLVERLLRGGPAVRVLATSRELLGAVGERTFPVSPLSMPERDDIAPESLARYESVRLFVDRATRAQPQFALTASNAPAVARVCRSLDGMPLALELAAARVRALPVEKIAERLGDRFRILTSGARTADRRQQTLRGLIDWSYDLLHPPERALLRGLSTFAGGWDLEAAEAVPLAASPTIEPWETLDLLQSLVDKSLVIYDGEAERYRLLETVRQYAVERAEEEGERATLGTAHAAWAVARAASLAPALAGPDQIAAAERLEADHGNLRAAHAFLAAAHDTDAAQRLVADLALFWDMRSYLAEGAACCMESLALGEGPWRLPALLGAGRLLILSRDPSAPAIYEEALRLARATADRRAEAEALHGIGSWAHYANRIDDAEVRFAAAFAIRQEIGDRAGVAASAHSLGNVGLRVGRYDEAEAFFEEALTARRALGDVRGVTLTTGALGQLAMMRGDLDAVVRLSREVVRRVSELRMRWTLALALSSLFHVAQERGELRRAAEFAGARSRVRELTGFPLPDVERADDAATQAALRDRLGAAAYDLAYAAGYARTWEGAFALALDEEDRDPSADAHAGR